MARRFWRWLWHSQAMETDWARDRRLPVWERPAVNRLYRIAMVAAGAAIIVFFLLWNLWWAA